MLHSIFRRNDSIHFIFWQHLITIQINEITDKTAISKLVDKVSRRVQSETVSSFEREEKQVRARKEIKAATSKMTLAGLESKIANVMRARLGRAGWARTLPTGSKYCFVERTRYCLI